MAILINNQTHESCLLQPHHSFGRLKSSVNTCILDPYISKVHAFIEWNGQHWTMRDVSSNGIWINAKKLVRDQVAQLNVGDSIKFSSKSGYGFEVRDLNPPCDILIPIDHSSETIELEYFHLLSIQGAPKVVLSYNNQTYSWWQELLSDNLDESAPGIELNDRELLNVDGLTWQLQINRTIDDTQQLSPNVASLDELTFLFKTSLDEEVTHLSMQSSDQTIDLLERSHHYLTLTLARQRAADIKANIDESEQGWVYAEILAKDLGLDASHLNIQIYRIRKQCIDALGNACDSSHIIERKAGKLRLGTKSFQIVKGDNVECDTSQYESLLAEHI